VAHSDAQDPQVPPGLDAPELVAYVEGLSDEAVDRLPFGVVRLDDAGKVLRLSAAEALQAGLGRRSVTGLAFFTDLAPCMGRQAFVQSLAAATARRTLDVRFHNLGDFSDATRELHVRVVSATAGGLWVFIERLA
jgi:photoactive yellow protein